MSQFRLALGLALAAVSFTLPPMSGLVSSAYAAEAMRPDVAKPLKEAGDLMKKGKYKEALAKVRDADAVGGKSGYESFVIDQMRASLAQQLGDNELALRSYEAVLNSGRLPAGDQLKYIEVIANLHFRARNYGKAITWINRYQKEGGNSRAMQDMLTQAYFQTNDCANATKDANAAIKAAEKAGQTPSEGQLQLVANCASKQTDKTAYVAAMEKLATYHPKKEYWLDLMNRLPQKTGFASRHQFDVFRMKHALGQVTDAAAYMELTQLALQAKYAIEGKKYIDQGFASKVLGEGKEAERQKRLLDLAGKKVEEMKAGIAAAESEAIKNKDARALADVGYNYVTMGQADKGLALMEQAVSMGGAKFPEDLKLHLGLAYKEAGKSQKAVQILKTVQGADGSADLARYWVSIISRPMK
ncbi:hypothetical protein V8J88_08065 [Massilia sp. W12]|uniref:hypothetical protein n=1 Tax=Massilia sp. W12 TaxID=3126507 RepID=UPI0030D4F70D